ncbi:MAG: cytochrome-ba3 oxidase subunit [Natronomonas sp.]
MELTPRLGLVAGLLALVPVVTYTVVNADYFAAISIVNVCLIVGSLYVAFSPIHAAENGSETAT